MEIDWRISEVDLKKVTDFVEQQSNPHVANRIARNIEHQGLLLNRNSILNALLFSLLYQYQRHGSYSKIVSFFQIDPFPLQYKKISNIPDIRAYIFDLLKQHGIIQDINKTPDYFSNNFDLLESTNWDLLNILEKMLQEENSQQTEREIADNIDTMFKGFGAIEARVFMQALGLTKFEIPIDTVISDWFNNFGIPVKLSAIALQDRNYYHFISDGIQLLCKKAFVYPCVLEAAIHSCNRV